MAGRLVAGAVGVVLGALSLAIASESPVYSFAGSTTGAAALLLAGWGLVGAGIVFWASRPTNRIGRVLVAAGAAWFVAEWDNPTVGSSVIFTTGLVLHGACPVLVALVMFDHPTGRLTGWAERVGVAALTFGSVLLLGVLTTTSFDPQASGCRDCPDNLFLLNGDAERAADFAGAGMWISTAACSGLVVAAGVRSWRSSRARRVIVLPGLAAGSLYLAAVAWVFAVNADRGYVGSGPLERQLWFAQAGALVLLAAAVVHGRVRSRRTRRSLVDVVVALGTSSSAGGLREALAQRLADPELRIGYAVGDRGWVDVNANDVPVDAAPGREATPLIVGGEAVAMIVHQPCALDDADLVAEVTSSASLLLDNERLQAGVRVREAELRASRARIVESGDTERRRLERDLHDGAQQRLVGLLLGVRLARTRADNDRLQRSLAEAEHELELAIDSLRDVAHGIHPAALSTFGLREALRSLRERTGTAIDVRALPGGRLPAVVETAVYQLIAEAAAKGPVVVDATLDAGLLRLAVGAAGHLDAMVELEDRIGALDGSVQVEPGDGGTVKVRAEIPCGS